MYVFKIELVFYLVVSKVYSLRFKNYFLKKLFTFKDLLYNVKNDRREVEKFE